MKIYIDKEEYWPVLELTKDKTNQWVDLSFEQERWVRETLWKFKDMQTFLIDKLERDETKKHKCGNISDPTLKFTDNVVPLEEGNFTCGCKSDDE